MFQSSSSAHTRVINVAQQIRLEMTRGAGMPSQAMPVSVLSEMGTISGAWVKHWDLAASVTVGFDACAALACETSRRLFGVSLTF